MSIRSGLPTHLFCVALLMMAVASTAEAQCIPAKAFQSIYGGPGADKVRFDPSGSENLGNEIGRFWQSDNSLLGHNFEGECPSTNEAAPAASWWVLSQEPRRAIDGCVNCTEDGFTCRAKSCPEGDLTVLIEDESAGGDDAYFIGLRVDPTPAAIRHWDYSRIDPDPSPSVVTMETFPSPVILGSSAVGEAELMLDLFYPDIAANVHAVHGPEETPLPASAMISGYDLYQYVGGLDPGRDAGLWALIEETPYADGPAESSIVVSCPAGGDALFLALGVSFDGGEGPDVVSALVGRAVEIDCSTALPLADAGTNQTVECASVDGTPVMLDGSGSFGAGSYLWEADGITFDDPTSATPTGAFPLGLTTVTLTVSDGEFSSVDTVEVVVVDSTPPGLYCAVVDGSGEDDELPDGPGSVLMIDLEATDLCDGDSPVDAAIDLGWANVGVADGHLFLLACTPGEDDEDEDEDCGSVFRCGDALQLEADAATLIAGTTDVSGNTSTCAVDLCGLLFGDGSEVPETSQEAGGLQDLRLDAPYEPTTTRDRKPGRSSRGGRAR